MINFIWSLLFFAIALGILVAVHEWGHFIVARLCGVKVERFSIGFGKVLWRRVDKKGTEFALAAIPLGGYVRMLDGRVDELSEADKAYAFNHKPVLQRIAIIAAGPLVNFIFAIFALMLMFMVGVQSVKPVLGDIDPGSIAGKAGMQAGEQIVRVGQQQTADWQAVNLELIAHIGREQLAITTTNEAGQAREYELRLQDWAFDPDRQSALDSLGLVPFRPRVEPKIAQVAENSPAFAANLRKHDEIIALDGTPVAKWEQIVEYLAARPNQKVTLTLLRGGMQETLDVRLDQMEVNGQVRGYLGVTPVVHSWPKEYLMFRQYGPVEAFFAGVDKTWRLMSLSVQMIGKLFTGDVSVKNLSGPISIAQGAGTSAGYGLVSFLSFLALISVNLGIINLLPLPVLDGGHLLYYFIELLSGRPVPESVQEIGFKIGGALLFLLMTIAILNDIARL